LRVGAHEDPDRRRQQVSSSFALGKAGHEVYAASDGEDGLRLARERVPDLVILDMMLPKLSGPEVLRALRKDPATAEIPVMVLTSLPQCNENRLLSEGATAYFQKSLLSFEKNPQMFVDTVHTLLRRVAQAKSKAAGSEQ
jgi:DNA-binding response OmpR family regulator